MNTKSKILKWIPRIICIISILFVSLFALDSFGEGKSFSEQIIGFLIHLIPSFVLIIFLIIAWKRELVGGIIFCIISLGFSPFIFIQNFKLNNSVRMSIGIIAVITFPFLISGILFIVSHYYKKDNPFYN